VNLIFKILITTFVLLLGFEFMVYALHLMNLPSDTAVYKGMACLAALFLCLPFALWRLWKRSL
jgi:hypothetical protein